MIKKIDILRGFMERGEWDKALSLAASFQRLGEHKKAIERAHMAITNPRFSTQIGLNIESAKINGINALKVRYLPANIPD